ncbi:Arm DNA-binding domain-containing protein [Roseovarius sp. SYSU LYC5161]|uniref:Arm DNA-binding domain-containing protein n=1 Tax=Roseovarius halophilus (ex Wu et al. 2025) TaxID=3376060 RepID=UPI003999CE2F
MLAAWMASCQGAVRTRSPAERDGELKMARGRNILTAGQMRKPRPGRQQDGGGLILHKTENGGRRPWRYSFAGRRRELGLGGLDAVTLAQACATRHKWAAVLADGRDPISERDRGINGRRTELHHADPTFAEIAEMVFEACKAGLREDGERGRWWSPLRLHSGGSSTGTDPRFAA